MQRVDVTEEDIWDSVRETLTPAACSCFLSGRCYFTVVGFSYIMYLLHFFLLQWLICYGTKQLPPGISLTCKGDLILTGLISVTALRIYTCLFSGIWTVRPHINH